MSLKNLTHKQGVLVSNLKDFENLKLIIELEDIKIDRDILDQTERLMKSTDHKFVFNPTWGGFIFLPVFLLSGGEPVGLVVTKVTEQEIKQKKDFTPKEEPKKEEKKVITCKNILNIFHQTENEVLRDYIKFGNFELYLSYDDDDANVTEKDVEYFDKHITDPVDRQLLIDNNFGITLEPKGEKKKEKKKTRHVIVFLG